MNTVLDIYPTTDRFTKSEWFVDDITNKRVNIGKVFKWNNKWFYERNGLNTYSNLFTTKKAALAELLKVAGVK
jgi:hypothetical protein